MLFESSPNNAGEHNHPVHILVEFKMVILEFMLIFQFKHSLIVIGNMICNPKQLNYKN